MNIKSSTYMFIGGDIRHRNVVVASPGGRCHKFNDCPVVCIFFIVDEAYRDVDMIGRTTTTVERMSESAAVAT